MAEGVVLRWPSVDYLQAMAEQQRLAGAVRDGTSPTVLILAEHPPVFTMGLSAPENEVLAPPPEIPVVRSDRGGRVTYHGPGQTMAYLIRDLRPDPRAVRRHVALLEETVIRALSGLGVRGERDPRGIGIWVGGAKIAAVGVRVAGGVAYHGVAVNRDPDLTPFRHIIPCGLPEAAVTSLARLGVTITRAAWEARLEESFRRQVPELAHPGDPPCPVGVS